jgi:hypothetical protein
MVRARHLSPHLGGLVTLTVRDRRDEMPNQWEVCRGHFVTGGRTNQQLVTFFSTITRQLEMTFCQSRFHLI